MVVTERYARVEDTWAEKVTSTLCIANSEFDLYGRVDTGMRGWSRRRSTMVAFLIVGATLQGHLSILGNFAWKNNNSLLFSVKY